jgi:hypothetical protein
MLPELVVFCLFQGGHVVECSRFRLLFLIKEYPADFLCLTLLLIQHDSTAYVTFK